MSIELIKELPSPEEIKSEFPLTKEQIELKKAVDSEIRDVFTGKSDKFIAVIGPCSADNEEAVLDYVTRLAKVYETIRDKVIVIPRVYTNKPRTTGEGYKAKAGCKNGIESIKKNVVDAKIVEVEDK